MANDFTGFDDFSKMLEKYMENTSMDNVLNVLEIGAEVLVQDVRALPRPRSQRSGGGWTHLLDTVTQKKNGEEVEVGSGKIITECSWKKAHVRCRPSHIFLRTFNRNQEKYYKKMQEALFE